MDVLGTCPSKSPIYVNSSHQLSVLGLFKGDVDEVKVNYQVIIIIIIMTSEKLPQTLPLSDGIWTIVLERKSELS